MATYYINVNNIYGFMVKGKSEKEVREEYFDFIRCLYFDNNMPLIQLSCKRIPAESRHTKEDIKNALLRQWEIYNYLASLQR